MKVLSLVLSLVLVVLVVPACADGFCADEGIVVGLTKISADLWEVCVCDGDGNEWFFLDDEGFYWIGDVVVLRLMESPEGDEITDVFFIERAGEQGLIDWFK